MNENENQIREALGAGIGAEPPITGGPAAVFAGARSRVLRTRAVTGALSVVAVLGVAAGAVAFTGGSGGAGAQLSADGGGQCTVSPPPPPSPEWAGGSARTQLDPQSALLMLKQVLACGTASGFQGRVQENASAPTGGVEIGGSLALTDQDGVGTVGIAVQQNGEWRKAQMTCPAHSGGLPCRAQTLADGTIVLTQELSLGSGGLAQVAEVLRPGGLHITVSALNEYTPWGRQPDNKPTRKNPPLTFDEVRTIAVDEPWSLTVAQDFAAKAKREITPYIDTVRNPDVAKQPGKP